MKSGENTATMQLIQEVQNGDENKMEKLLMLHEGLIRCVSKRFANRGVESEDLYQICCIGFIKAVRKFNLELGLCFSTYAVPTMCGEIKRFLRDDGILKVSRKLQELSLQIFRIQEERRMAQVQAPSLSELAKLLETTEEEIVLAQESVRPPESLHSILHEDGNHPVFLIDVLEGAGEREQGEYERIVERESVRSAMDVLNEDERRLVGLRFYKNMTQSKTAEIMGVSQVQVSRLEKRILQKMRDVLSV